VLAAFPVVAYYAQNQLELEPIQIVRPLLASLLLAALAIGISYLFARQCHASLLLSLFLLLVVAVYPLIYSIANQGTIQFARHRYLLPVYCVLSLATFAYTARRVRTSNHLEQVTNGLNVFAIILCLVVFTTSVVPILQRAFASPPHSAPPLHANWAKSLAAETRKASDHQGTLNRPDFYYVILDEYARADILESRFEFQNELPEALRRLGFFVADKSHSNYPWTHLSLAATLNCEYLQELLPDDLSDAAPSEQRSRYQYFVSRLGGEYIRSNRVRQFLQEFGYQWRTADTGYAVTRDKNRLPDEVLGGPVTEFERMLLSKTLFDSFIPLITSTGSRHEVIRHLLDGFSAAPKFHSPKFVFYHIVSPHGPFCFDVHGGKIDRHPVYETSMWLDDRLAIPGYKNFYRTNYPKNVAGLNVHAIKCLETLMARTEGQAVIIVQSDHGSSLNLDPFGAAASDVQERFGILNAIYLPERYPRDGLDESISSVNTFRVVLQNVFGVRLPKLEDRAWFSSGDLEFIEVTDRLTPSDKTVSEPARLQPETLDINP
jgi:hypothetical protein